MVIGRCRHELYSLETLIPMAIVQLIGISPEGIGFPDDPHGFSIKFQWLQKSPSSPHYVDGKLIDVEFIERLCWNQISISR
jgi:hypothetical protein